MTAQLDLFGTPATPAQPDRPVLRRVDLQDATRIRTNYGDFDLLQVNHDSTVTIRSNPMTVPHVVPFHHIEGIVR